MSKKPIVGTAKSRAENSKELSSIRLELLRPLFVAIASGVIGIATYVMTPVNESINRWMWGEKAEMLLVAQNTSLREGDPFKLDIFLQPTSPVPLSEGTLQINYPKKMFRLAPENILVYQVPKLTSSKRITERSVVLLADSAGKGRIDAEFQTKNGLRVHKAIEVEVVEVASQTYPTLRNFSGTWIIDLGRVQGTMALKDRERSINGEYRLVSGEQGQIEGVRDGKTFRVTLYRGAKPSRWWIEGVFDPDPNTDLEIRGMASLQIAAPDSQMGWKMGDVPEPFHAVARTR